MSRLDFLFTQAYQIGGLPFGVTPSTTWVEVSDDELRVRFGPWRLVTPLDNIAGCSVTGPYTFVKTAGPPHLSFTDKGITFATNGDQGLCVRFHDPVPAIDPWGRIRHPAATLTVVDPDELAALLGHD